MAEKQFALGGTRSAAYLEDEDPLAELARIVGFQEQAAIRSRPVAPEPVEPVLAEFPAGAAVQAEIPAAGANPVADLEDELLRAFEVYDAPRGEEKPGQVVSAAMPAASAVAAPARTEPVFVAAAGSAQDEDEDPFGALAAVVAASASVVRPQPAAQAAPQIAPQVPAAARVEPTFSMPEIETASVPDFSVDLLEEELMQSLGEAALADMPEALAVEPPAAAQVEVKAPRATPEAFRFPLTNFQAQPKRQDPAIAASPATVAETAPVMAAPEVQENIEWDLPGVVADEAQAPEEPLAAPVLAGDPAPAASQHGVSMDAMLDDIARYELPANVKTSPVMPRDPAFDASLAAISGISRGLADGRAEPSVTWPEERAPLPQQELQAEAAEDAGQEDLFDAADFELDIEELEQDLTDLSFLHEPAREHADAPMADHETGDNGGSAEEPVALEPFADFVAESAEAPAAAEAAPAEPEEEEEEFIPVVHFEVVRTPAPQPEPPPAPYEAPVRTPAVEPAYFTAASPEAVSYSTTYAGESVYSPPTPDYGSDDGIVFDPAMLAEAEDPVEAVGEIDVPEIRMPEPEEPAMVVPDYDLDIDAEMASLFGSLPNRQSADERSAPQRQDGYSIANFGSGPAKGPASVDTFDEFERALEDDFRSMLTQPLGQGYAVSGKPLQPPAAAPARDRGTLRAVLLAACATGVIAFVGLGGYMLMSRGGDGLMSGEPRIIAADKGPVKVAPANPGGVTVPNQDKAVYDRVAGKEADVVKQSALVTTEEEPVDVVQKTLVPENTFDNEAEGDMPAAVPGAATPVEDTRDARLLPADTAAAENDARSNAPGGVAVRKVRTMIVKADGTLVPREDASPAVADTTATVTAAPLTAAPAPALAQPAETPADTPETDGLRTDERLPASPAAAEPVPANEAPASAETLASVANSDVETTAPVRTVRTSTVSDNAPVPTARPSDQPVNVVGAVTEKGNIRPVPQEAASVTPEAPAEAAAAPAPPSGSYGIQIASLPSEADAKASIAKMASKFGSVLGGRPIGIRQANIPNKGTYYRLRVDVGTRDQANALCAKLKAAGGSCLVSK